MFELRHKIEIAIILILGFTAFCTQPLWIEWAFATFIAFMVLVIGNFNSKLF